ncbi:hypothetical protein CFP56_027634 [Quercus suber]|uniref:Uncharacterized protein n=1 Tax=Quercus suber TaxID=58331 RepID=A0AAW0JY36_QUESU
MHCPYKSYIKRLFISLGLLNVEDCASARQANELNLSSASKGKQQSLSVFVNGSVHWLAHVGNVDTDSEDDYSDDDPPCNVIFTFNIRDEVFCKMDVPKYYEDTFDLNMMVALSLVLLNVEDDALRKQAKSSTASKGIRAKVKRKRKAR